MPARQQRCPNRAPGWSPMLAPITARPPQTAGSVTPGRPAVGPTAGSIGAGTPNRSSSPGSQADAVRSYNIVRAAIDGSLTCAAPPVRCQVSQQLMSPNSNSPAAALRRAPGTWSSSHRSLLALNAASSGSPVLDRMSASWPAARSWSQNPAARLSRQLIAGYTAVPVARSHTTNVSVCAASPIPATSAQPAATWPIASPTAPSTLARISPASCSTQPAAGKKLASGRLARASGRSSPSRTTHLLDELPWSIASSTVTALSRRRPPGRQQYLADLAGDRRAARQPALEDRAADGEPPRPGRRQCLD